jgi:hypothetical protein
MHFTIFISTSKSPMLRRHMASRRVRRAKPCSFDPLQRQATAATFETSRFEQHDRAIAAIPAFA